MHVKLQNPWLTSDDHVSTNHPSLVSVLTSREELGHLASEIGAGVLGELARPTLRPSTAVKWMSGIPPKSVGAGD